MTFGQSIRTCLRYKYITFSGRASRSEYWWFNLFYWLVLVVPMMSSFVIIPISGESELNSTLSFVWIIIIAVGSLFSLVLILPGIAVAVRRLHDRDMSGWWFLGLVVASMIPFVGFIASIAFLVIMCLKGTDGPNRFGPDPLKPAGAEIFA